MSNLVTSTQVNRMTISNHLPSHNVTLVDYVYLCIESVSP